MDAKNPFLNVKMEELVYLQPPPGLKIPQGHCFKLNREIYGLKQAHHMWYRALKELFLSIKFIPSKSDPFLFTSQVKDLKCFVHVYVNDMIIISHDVGFFKSTPPMPSDYNPNHYSSKVKFQLATFQR